MALNDNNSKRKWKNRTLISSLEFALTGIVTAIGEERNLKSFLFLAIFLVIAFEIVNSAIENVVDLASDYHFSMLAKKAKDMAAGAVLVMSGYAVITGLIIFLPKLIHMFFRK